ncbi:hypothetical protein BTA51_02945 [Hahella sp. CCB-MM4]|uniref:DUF7482 domain-containing protein n=1 Tax=Hahella sp. (strain CCB-MM4) TaxID=1926491 RepID=UPI000B9C73BE|nr:hypothetical protein [Hahella sp. CCB-MM4]OZG75355.1 hypothetical protein BTA51_02945 [Hahella sp. CCB-MM4]
MKGTRFPQQYPILLAALIFVLSGCQSLGQYNGGKETITLPLVQGWFEDQKVYYITTDVSDHDMAVKMNAVYAPRLRDALPSYPKPPGLKTAIERVYRFPGTNFKSVFPSAPEPFGPQSENTHYSPLWLLYEVHWNPGTAPHQLTSEEAILEAEEQQLVTIHRTDIVVNCPIVQDATGASLGIKSSDSKGSW